MCFFFLFFCSLNHALRHHTSLCDHSRTATERIEPATLLSSGETRRASCRVSESFVRVSGVFAVARRETKYWSAPGMAADVMGGARIQATNVLYQTVRASPGRAATLCADFFLFFFLIVFLFIYSFTDASMYFTSVTQLLRERSCTGFWTWLW